MVQVGFGRVDRDDRHTAEPQYRAALPEQLFEVHVADVAGIVIAGDDDQRLAAEPVEVLLRLRVLGLEPERGQVAGADDEVG